MSVQQGIFGDTSNFDERFVPDYERLSHMVESLKNLGTRIVLTSGSFDLVHEGHALYLEEAKRHGGLLIVGVDSDAKIRHRKGPDRPVVPERERLRMLTHLRPVDLVTLKSADEAKWALIRAVRPDVLIATQETYDPDQIAELESELVGKVVVLPRQATTTTTARLRLLTFGLADRITEALQGALPQLVKTTIDEAVGRSE